jgi:hypothetical protein
MSKKRKSRILKNQNNINQGVQKPLDLDEIFAIERRIGVEKTVALQKALSSTDVNQILKAQNYLQQKKEDLEIKSLLVDPIDAASSFGYKDKPYQLSYDMLRAMAKTHIIKAIIQTRKAQVQAFCEPQANKYSSTGFVIDKKRKWGSDSKDKIFTKEEEKKKEFITEFILNCGTVDNFWHADTFERFIGKLVDDALTLDQSTFEIVRDRAKRPVEFFATDGATYRIADSFNDGNKYPDIEEINGYKPFYVQLYQGKVQAQFYPWELCFGVRNPSTDIRTNGYGKSELEDLIALVTAILNADAYNANFFKVGSSPNGIITYSGNINQNTLNDFRQNWMSMVSGVNNAHKIPVINGDKINFIPTNVPNKDMEFGRFQEFLIKCGCAVYTIDPSEIGFPMSGNTEGTNGLGGDNTGEKIKFSRDKGLRPLLKNIQYWINKYLVYQIDSEFELRFVGDDDFENKETELEQDIKRVGNFMTLNEIREKNNLKSIEGGDIVLNPIAAQLAMLAFQGNPESNQAIDDGSKKDDNPFLKSLQTDIEKLLSN